ncbi:MAG: O-antigen ligase family protein [Oligoflexia bacterium]|nr:O-antigen ligase family protein [Oligoflexia bacterium]MBF0366410.1 O-antigen ligase family protein [Oligoflexia bacterium]
MTTHQKFILFYAPTAFLALGTFTSISICSVHHIALFVAAIALAYCWKDSLTPAPFFSLSTLTLVGILLTGILSVGLNWGEILHPWRHLFALKYFFFGLLSVFIYAAAVGHEISKIKWKGMIALFIIATTIATLSGLLALYSGHHFLRMKAACHPSRACGMYGMYMTYGYGIQFFMILLTGFILERKKFLSLKESWITNGYILTGVWLINLAGLLLSGARGAIFGFCFSLPFFFIRRGERRYIVMVLLPVLLLMAAAFTFSPKVKEMFLSFERLKSNSIRISQAVAAIEAFKSSPLLGIGYKNFEPNSAKIKIEKGIEFPEFAGHAHNNFLEHLAGTGALGFLMLFLFHLFWAIECYRARNSSVGRMVFPFVVALAISGLFQYTMGDGENMFLIMAVYAWSQVFMMVNANGGWKKNAA